MGRNYIAYSLPSSTSLSVIQSLQMKQGIEKAKVGHC